MKLKSAMIWCALLSACGGQPEATQERQTDLETLDPQGQEIVFWYQHTREREEALQELIADFNQRNDHKINVRGEYVGRYGDIYNKMNVGIQSGSLAASLVVAYQNQALAYYQADGIVDIMPYIDSPKWGLSPREREDYVQSFLMQDNVNGVQIGFPPNRSMELLYYNLDWLRELGFDGPPATWDDFAAMCHLAREKPFSKSENKARSLGFLLDIDASRLAAMVFSRGGDLVNATGSAYALDSPEVKASLELMRDLMAADAIDIVGEQDSELNEFVTGQILFSQDSSSGMPYYQSGIEDSGLDFAWGVTHPPQTGSTPVVDVYGASVSLCAGPLEKQLAAWLFLKWLTAPQQQALWVRASNYFPVRKSTARELESYFEENPHYGVAFGMLDYGKSEPTMAGYQQVRRLIQEAMVEAIEGGDIERVLGDLQYAANRTIEQ
jgi:multiple sugar transport system substrate-binding protein